jgi:hypothetical protein
MTVLLVDYQVSEGSVPQVEAGIEKVMTAVGAYRLFGR